MVNALPHDLYVEGIILTWKMINQYILVTNEVFFSRHRTCLRNVCFIRNVPKTNKDIKISLHFFKHL